jgi:hypothetical protein
MDFDHYEDELDAIRLDLYEKIKNLSPQERVAFFNDKARNVANKYGFTLIKDVSEGVYAFEKRLYGDKISHTDQDEPV